MTASARSRDQRRQKTALLIIHHVIGISLIAVQSELIFVIDIVSVATVPRVPILYQPSRHQTVNTSTNSDERLQLAIIRRSADGVVILIYPGNDTRNLGKY
jgi:hypothetical protein